MITETITSLKNEKLRESRNFLALIGHPVIDAVLMVRAKAWPCEMKPAVG